MFGIDDIVYALASCLSVAKVYGSIIEDILTKEIEVLKIVVEAVLAIARVFGIEVEDDAAQLGDRALQAGEAGITLESCDGDHDRYLQEIRDFSLDPAVSETTSEAEKLGAALMVIVGAIDEKREFPIGTFLTDIARDPEYFTQERVLAYLSTLDEAGFSPDSVTDYFDKTARGNEAATIEEVLARAECSLDPSLTEDQARARLQAIRST